MSQLLKLLADQYLGGMPIADDLRTGKIEIVAGILRQDLTDKTQWYFIDDGNHIPIGFDTTYQAGVNLAVLDNVRLMVKFAKTYTGVVSIIAIPDELLAREYHLSIGPSVGFDGIELHGRISRQISGRIYYDGAQWVATNGTYQGTAPTIGYTGGVLTVTHGADFCPGDGVCLTPESVGGSVSQPYLPVLHTVADGSFQVQFYDPGSNQILNTAASTRMAFRWTKSVDIMARFDGTGGHDAIPFHTGGNIWVLGIMKV